MSHKKNGGSQILTVKGCRREKIKPKKYLAQTLSNDIAEFGLFNFLALIQLQRKKSLCIKSREYIKLVKVSCH